MQPLLTQVPPKRLRSATATRQPAPARRPASDGPACPVPMMIASYFVAMLCTSSRSKVRVKLYTHAPRRKGLRLTSDHISAGLQVMPVDQGNNRDKRPAGHQPARPGAAISDL